VYYRFLLAGQAGSFARGRLFISRIDWIFFSASIGSEHFLMPITIFCYTGGFIRGYCGRRTLVLNGAVASRGGHNEAAELRVE